MNNEELNTVLFKKMLAEQDEFRDWLKGQPPEEILSHAHEYTIREDILLDMEYHDLSDAQAKMMLESRDVMSDLFKQYENLETGYMDTIWECIENRAGELLKAQQEMYKTPVYPHSASYAREHGELEQYRNSYQANVACKEAIENAVRENYRDNTLHKDAVSQVVGQFGSERTAYVLAATVQHKDWDGRISNDNKAWAKTIPMPDDKDSLGTDRSVYFVVDQCHTGLTDLFLSRFRKEQVLQKDKQQDKEKRPSVLKQLRTPTAGKDTAAPKKKEVER